MNNYGSPPALPLWQRIENIRLREGWTRTQVAIHAGVARTTLDSWRRQPRPPLAPTIRDVADRLGIDRDEALRLAGILVGDNGDVDPLVEYERRGDADPRIIAILQNTVFTDEEKAWMIEALPARPRQESRQQSESESDTG